MSIKVIIDIEKLDEESRTEVNMNGPKGKYAWTATVGEKGQIVIPKQAREIFGIKPGDTILLLGDEERGIAIPPKNSFMNLFEAAYKEKGEEEK